jgi:hypothetical protein
LLASYPAHAQLSTCYAGFSVLQAVGLTRYEQFLRAYAVYQHWDSSMYDDFLQGAKTVARAPSPNEMDDGDRSAADYFRTPADGLERLIIFKTAPYTISR